ncbi:MAG: ammonia-forming cytochrome c nitrite reductase subunit c552, partial [Proteobacteria bacterium]|nr:ammonia-forming cytochrome c nitrite reductase subunit c552 [Pseudomonadota bacterium]
NPGGSTTNSGEGRDFQLGHCASQMACTTCHDPHAADAPGKLARLATPAGNATCTACHPTLAAPAALAKHSHHTTVSCVDCHLPKKNMGLDYALVRYHRIGSPTDAARVTGDRPVECALCHRDRSVEQLVTTMETWWGKTFDRAALHRLYGPDLSRNALRAALDGLPHEQAVAIAVLGEAKDRSAIPLIARHLAHAYPLVRFFAQRALQTITGLPVAIDLNAAAATIRPLADDFVRASTTSTP